MFKIVAEILPVNIRKIDSDFELTLTMQHPFLKGGFGSSCTRISRKDLLSAKYAKAMLRRTVLAMARSIEALVEDSHPELADALISPAFNALQCAEQTERDARIEYPQCLGEKARGQLRSLAFMAGQNEVEWLTGLIGAVSEKRHVQWDKAQSEASKPGLKSDPRPWPYRSATSDEFQSIMQGRELSGTFRPGPIPPTTRFIKDGVEVGYIDHISALSNTAPYEKPVVSTGSTQCDSYWLNQNLDK